jgi:hypothetical protein
MKTRSASAITLTMKKLFSRRQEIDEREVQATNE